MNNQARFCKLKCKYNIQGICHAYGECIAKDLFIEELEKIKAEIQHERSKHSGEGKYTYTAGLKVSIDIIDNHISELKGENND